MTEETATFYLAPAMRLEQCEAFDAFLRASRADAVTVDCANVSRLGGMAAQQIVMAQKIWAAAGHEFALINVSDGMQKSLSTLGLDILLPEEVATV
ncbi:MAG: STAS domain-containing protein [Pseudomonadota bacterium]